ncbi:BRO-N domain-containing protein [Paraburkholderia tuberum]|uniref:BRO-N domain-containing protein n=1 Tax=Paraburkholderia tuberum TaxID=157910 RepID=UPI003D2D14B1
MTVIPERDVYRLVMPSKFPAAEKFGEWVAREVLPSVRKTGSYSLAPAASASSCRRTLAKPFALRQIKRNKSNRRKAFGVAVPAVEFVERYVEATGLTGSAKSPSCSTQTSVTSARSCMKKHHVSPWRRLDAYQNHIDVSASSSRPARRTNTPTARRNSRRCARLQV